MFDVIISNGTIIDGSDSSGFISDIGIVSDRIKVIGDLSDSIGKKKIDANGYIVSPGFIDTHAHSDGVLLIDPQHANGIRQGITTEILGQDGLSYAPLSKENYKIYRSKGSLLYIPYLFRKGKRLFLPQPPSSFIVLPVYMRRTVLPDRS